MLLCFIGKTASFHHKILQKIPKKHLKSLVSFREDIYWIYYTGKKFKNTANDFLRASIKGKERNRFSELKDT